jgi:hypothetical protein
MHTGALRQIGRPFAPFVGTVDPSSPPRVQNRTATPNARHSPAAADPGFQAE